MATEVSDRDAIAPQDHALINGDHQDGLPQDAPNHTANAESFEENAALPAKEPTLNLRPSAPGPDPAGPTPTEDVSSGIQPVADFVPKDAPTLSHPTPPPEEALVTSEANVDTQMANVDTEMANAEDAEAAPPAAIAADAPVSVATNAAATSAESSLVRPRDDDDDEAEVERAAKRNKVDDDVAQSVEMVTEPASAEPAAPLTNGAAVADQSFRPLEPTAEAATTENAPAPASEVQTDIKSTATDAPVEEHQSVVAPAPVDPSSAPAAETVDAKSGSVDPPPAPAAAEVDAKPAPADPPSAPASSTVEADAKLAADVKPSVEATSGNASTAAPRADAKYSTAPMTNLQKTTLLEKMKNLKKTKHSGAFLRPVDPIAQGIPSYLETIKKPMDLGTMDSKLKTDQYESVQAFADDFDQIIQNCRTFNGDAHPITQSAFNIQAYFNRAMESVPGPDAVASMRAPKRQSPQVKNQARREPRVPAPPAQAPPPVGLDRRESIALGREPRTVKPTGPREIPYAKPKRKESALELKFCDHILTRMEDPALNGFNMPFLNPVDPVALNIPHYRNIIKNPMDLSTMGQKLRSGQYSKASEFRKDFDLMIDNCLLFNPQGNPVRDMGIAMRREFERLWKEKDKWERQNKPEIRGTSASADEESDEEEEDDDPEDDKARQIKMLQEQLAAMQNMIGGLVPNAAAKKSKKAKGDKKSKSATVSAMPKQRAAPAPPKKKAGGKTKQVTYEEKQEISEAVGRMNEGEVAELTSIITNNCAKYRDMDEMELEIDDLPNDVQALLLKYVRKLFGRPKHVQLAAPDSPPDAGAEEDDEEYVAERGARGAGGGGSKRKKHKPMSKQQQTAKMAELQNKLAQFDNVGTSGSQSPTAAAYHQTAAESSGDDESEESEEE